MSGIGSRTGFTVLLAAVAGAGVLAPAALGAPQPPVPVSIERRADPPSTAALTQRLVHELRGDGFEITVGYPKVYSQRDCDEFTYPQMQNCFANNPAAPYIVPVVQSWPEEFVDPATANALGRTRPGYSSTYRLDPREAIVVLGELPPQARYFGLQSWVFTKEWLTPATPWAPAWYDFFASRAPDLVDYLFATVPANSARLQSFSSISNNINNVVIAEQSGAAFGQTRYFVITPDQVMDRTLREALTGLGVRPQDVFTEPIPARDAYGSIGSLGLGPQDNEFVTGLRYAMPDDEQAASAWRSSLPLTVLRIRQAPASDRPAEPYPLFVEDARTAEPEAPLAPGMSELVAEVCATAGQAPWSLDTADSGCADAPPYLATRMIDLLDDLGQFGPRCRSIGMNCLGDGQDASYFLARSMPLDDGQVYATVGPLATQTGNATYVGLSINDVSTLKGVANIPDLDVTNPAGDLTGSAEIFEQPGQDFSSYFVHFFTRDCSAIRGLAGGACTSITADMVPRAGDLTAPGDVDLLGKFSAAVRAYVKPGTARGPDPALQLRPRVLTFHLR